jgi:hypothetical protein
LVTSLESMSTKDPPSIHCRLIASWSF